MAFSIDSAFFSGEYFKLKKNHYNNLSVCLFKRGGMLNFVIAVHVLGIYVIFAILLFPFYFFSRGRRLGGIFLRSSSRLLMKIFRVTCDTEGLENIDPQETYFVAANHQSIADIPIICAVLPLNMRILAKKELFKIPIFGQTLLLYDFVAVDRRNKRSAVSTLKLVEKKMKFCSFLVFPEGTRTKDGHVGQFKSGALFLTENGCKILPVAITGLDKIMRRDSFAIRSGHVKIKIFPPTTIGGNEDRHELAQRLQTMISDYVEKNQFADKNGKV